MVSKRKLMYCAFTAGMAMLSAGAAHASILVYTFSGVGSGTIGGTPFTNASFTTTFTLNTTALTSPAGGYSEYSGVSGNFSEGAVNTTLTGATIEVNGNANTGVGNFEDIFLFNSDFGNSIGISQDAVFLGYDLSTPLTTGVVTGAQIGAFTGGAGFSTGAGTLIFTSLNSLDFTAAAQGTVPEPSTLVLLACGAIACSLKRRLVG